MKDNRPIRYRFEEKIRGRGNLAPREYSDTIETTSVEDTLDQDVEKYEKILAEYERDFQEIKSMS